jgi:phosphoglycerate dehydrogenase-like enzyme
MLTGIFILDDRNMERIYPLEVRSRLEKYVSFPYPQLNARSVREQLHLLHDVDVIFSSWGAPLMDEAFLTAAPNLKAVFYGAGTIKSFVTDAFWDRNIVVTSAFGANAIPVAEFTLSQILFSLKKGWYFVDRIKSEGKYPGMNPELSAHLPGLYRSTVGLISMGMIGRHVRKLLQAFDLQVIAYDPFLTEAQAKALAVERCSLEELFRSADVVSLHTPLLPETTGMVTGEHLNSMKPYASFINTSRGAIVREDEMIEVLQRRPDLHAILDVTYPEPPVEGSPLYTLPNVILTPHIAGALAMKETMRMGEFMADELERYVQGQPLRYAISWEQAKTLA